MPAPDQILQFKKSTDGIRQSKWNGFRDVNLIIPAYGNHVEEFSGTELVFLEHPGNRTDFAMALSDGEQIFMPDAPLVITIWQHPYSKIRFFNLTTWQKL